MRPGEALAHVRLVEEDGTGVRAAFLDLSQELWDPSGRRLTLLLDPGRVKRGIRTNLEMGRPLVAGHRYRLRIEPGWRNLAGTPMTAAVERRLVAAPADYTGPDPAGWTLVAPAATGREPLVVRLGEPVDQALALRLLLVRGPQGAVLPGRPSLDRDGRVWRFEPSRPWTGGRHRLEVSPELEDPAGNRPGRAFDEDLAAEGSSHDSAAPLGRAATGRPMPVLVRWFEPTVARIARRAQ